MKKLYQSLIVSFIGVVSVAICFGVGFSVDGDFRYLFFANVIVFTVAGFVTSRFKLVSPWLRIILLNLLYFVYYVTQLVTPGILIFPLFNILATLYGMSLFSIWFRLSTLRRALLSAVSIVVVLSASILLMPTVSRFITTAKMTAPAPSFQLTDVGGRRIYSEDFASKVMIVDFWATWCGSCIAEFSELEKVKSHFEGNESVAFLVINVDDGGSIDKTRGFLQRRNFNLPFYIDDKYKTYKRFNVEALPTLFVVDTKGNLKSRTVGFNGADDYSNNMITEIERLIAAG